MPDPADQGIAVFGYSEVGHRCLELLLRRRARVVAVFTHADAPDERRWFGSVAELARDAGIPVHVFEDPRDPALLDALRATAPDLLFSFYYRQLLPPEVLAVARLGAFNMHGSLLPRYRGRAPVNWAVLNGETETGATLHHMLAKADAGDIVDQERVPIGPEDTAAEVGTRVADASVRILDRRLAELCEGRAPRRPQDELRATRFGRRRPEDGRIDWSRSAREVVDLVRAVTRPFPGAFTDTEGGRLFVWRARVGPSGGHPGTVLATNPLTIAAGDRAVEILDASLEGRAIDGQQWPPGAPLESASGAPGGT